MSVAIEAYSATHKVRLVTATSLFDGHDAATNMIRRLLQASGAEIIHLGHNRSVDEIVTAAIQEDAQGIAVSCYQGGHVEFFKYIIDLLKERGEGHIKVFGGGGGVIVPNEVAEIEAYGVAKIFSPEDGRRMGLQGMINLMLQTCDFTMRRDPHEQISRLAKRDIRAVNTLVTLAEQSVHEHNGDYVELRDTIRGMAQDVPVVGITGTGGAGKSSITDELVRRFRIDFPEKSVAILAVDPSRQRTGGALLGDRIRMNSINSNRIYMRSLATRESRTELSAAIQDAIEVTKAAGFDLIFVETSGIGQGNAGVVGICDVSLYVMTCEFGAPTQLEKIDMLDFADVVAINKFERKGAEDALRNVRKQYRRNRNLFDVAGLRHDCFPVQRSGNERALPGTDRCNQRKKGRRLDFLPSGNGTGEPEKIHHTSGSGALPGRNRPYRPRVSQTGGGAVPCGPPSLSAEGGARGCHHRCNALRSG
ncbi:MAG: cobalamin-dependent protein [Oryzomonas sp.]|nr:cobalamin-dependent protein [Oryzomonas sp.]MDR3580128.1 cobalamin-dependent protein [Oryzomonas sp.]